MSPTKDSQLVTLRLGNGLIRAALELAGKEGMTCHAWCVRAIQTAVDKQSRLYKESNAWEALDQGQHDRECSR
jgi:hypothetical protein